LTDIKSDIKEEKEYLRDANKEVKQEMKGGLRKMKGDLRHTNHTVQKLTNKFKQQPPKC